MTAVERVTAFLDAREVSPNLDPEIITGFNGKFLYVADLREIVELAWRYEKERTP